MLSQQIFESVREEANRFASGLFRSIVTKVQIFPRGLWNLQHLKAGSLLILSKEGLCLLKEH